MEFQFPSWPFLLSLFLPALFFVLMKKKNSRPFLPPLPGPAKLPIIGNLHNLILGSGLIHHRLRDLAEKHGPLMHLQLGQISNVIVSSSDVAREFLKTNDVCFATRPETVAGKIFAYGSKGIVLGPYGEYWRQMRKVCVLELLSAKRVMSFRRSREDEVCKMVNIITKAATTSTPINMSKLFLSLSNNIITRAAFGDKCKYQEELMVSMKEGFKLIGGFNIHDFFPSLEEVTTRLTGARYKMEKAHMTMDYICEKIIDEHKERSEALKNIDHDEYMLDIFLRLQKKNEFDFEFTMDNLKAILLDMLAAGTDTSAITLEWAMSELMRNPEVMKKAKFDVRKSFKEAEPNAADSSLLKDMPYLQNVIKENFRLHPPGPFLIPRVCREKCQINGYEIKEGSRVNVNIWAIGRDPNKWKHPEVFKPERFIGNQIDFRGSHFDLIPFGSGRRGCPGITFGLATVELALATILHRFDWKMPNGVSGTELDMTESFAGAVSRKHHLLLVPQLPTTTSTTTV